MFRNSIYIKLMEGVHRSQVSVLWKLVTRGLAARIWDTPFLLASNTLPISWLQLEVGNQQLFNYYSSWCMSLQDFSGKFSLSHGYIYIHKMSLQTMMVEMRVFHNRGRSAGFEWQMRVLPTIGGSLGTYGCDILS